MTLFPFRPRSRAASEAPCAKRRMCAGALATLVTLLVSPQTVFADDPFPIMGQSLGGHWRDLASVDSDLMGTLPPGRAVPILGRSDVTYNGYHWFEIEVGRVIGYQWGGILCSNDRQIDGLKAQCDPADLTEVGAGAGGLTSIQGRYMEGRGDITGGDQDRCEGWHPQVTPSYLSIDANESQMSFYLYDCDIESTEPLGTGLRINGQCTLNGTGEAELPALTDADRVLDVLAFYKDNGNTLLLVDQTGPDSGYISSYMLCNR